jgi:hypothetical protein
MIPHKNWLPEWDRFPSEEGDLDGGKKRIFPTARFDPEHLVIAIDHRSLAFECRIDPLRWFL